MIVKPIIESLEMLDIDDDTYFKEYASYISNSRLSMYIALVVVLH